MNKIQFVFEKPQKPVRTVKKRSRLITSCDACRLKKTKCRPTGHRDGKCEACESSGSVCVFDERDRIRSQRGIASFTVAPTRHSLRIQRPLPASTSALFVAAHVNEVLRPQRLLSSSTSYARQESLNSGEGSASNIQHYYISHTAERHASHESLDNSFFDPHRQAYPHPRLLPHLVDAFLLYAGSIFPFFDPDQTALAAREGTLSPLIANCLAAYAARFSDEIHHLPDSRHLSGEPFLDVAKYLLSGAASSKLEQLHATILISWAENGSGRTLSFLVYSQMASSLATELRLGSEEHICQDPCETSRNRSRSTFWSVAWLEIIACSVTGKLCTLRLDECSTSMPHPEIRSCGSLSRTMVYQAFKVILNLMVAFNDCSNAGKPSIPSLRRDIGLRQLQHAITTFQDGLPLSLAFNRENICLTMFLREPFAFYLVHVLMHCFLVISHCPSLFWASQPPQTITEVPRLDIAWSSAMAIVDILNLLRSENVMFANGLPSTFIPLSIARGVFFLAQINIEGALSGTVMSVEDFELTNRFYLDQSALMLQNLSRYWASMLQVEISAEPVALCGIQSVSGDQKDVPFPLRPLSFHYRMPQPSSASILAGPLTYPDSAKESDEHESHSGKSWNTPLAACKEVAVVDNFALARRYLSWQDMGQPSSSV